MNNMWPTCMHLIWVNWQAKCERQVSLQTDSTILTAWTSLAPIATRCMVNTLMFETASGLGCHQPTFTKTTSIPLKLHIPTIPEKMMKRCISQSPWIAILEAKKPHRVLFCRGPQKTACFPWNFHGEFSGMPGERAAQIPKELFLSRAT